MKLISREAARVSLKAVPDEIKPLNGYDITALVAAITARYGFAKSPSYEETRKTGAEFQDGRLADKNIYITHLGIYSDGVGATTTNTSNSEIVVNDVYAYLKKHFGLREPSTKLTHALQSELVVEFENNPDRALKPFEPLMQLLQSEAKRNELKRPVQFSRIDFASDPVESSNNMVFLIERRAGIPYESNRYYCRASMRTDDHIRALELLEEILTSKR